jgi:uncharacterized protein YukE
MASLADLMVHIGIDGDDLSSGLDNLSQKIDSNIGKISAMGAIGGAALEGFARSQQETNVALERMSRVTGMGSDALREMASETQNATFPMGEVVALMETATQRGLRGEGIREYAQFWDMVGDATGEAGPKLGEMGIALAAVGIEAGNEAEALAAFGFITDNTTSSVSEFLTFLERTGPQLGEMGASVDDAAAILGILESEFGLSGRTARTKFNQAINESDGTLQGMLDTLGVSSEQFEMYTAKVEGSSGAIEANAQAYADSMTPMQKFQAGAENLMMQYGGLADAAGMLAVPLLALGPLMKGVSVLWKVASSEKIVSMAATTAATVKNVAIQIARWVVLGVQSTIAAAKVAAAWLISMGPIVLVVAAVVGLVALIIANFDKIKEVIAAGWEWVKRVTKEFVSSFVDTVTGLKDTIVSFFSNAGTWLVEAGKNIIRGLIDGIKSMISGIGDAIGGVASKIRNFLPFSPAKEGPLSGSGSPEIAGAKIVEMMASGMNSGLPGLAAVADSAARAAMPNVGSVRVGVSGVRGGDGGSYGNHYHLHMTTGHSDADVLEQFRRMELVNG